MMPNSDNATPNPAPDDPNTSDDMLDSTTMLDNPITNASESAPNGAARIILTHPTRANTSAQQDKFLLKLLDGQPVGEAARAAGVSRSTGLRWRRDPAFAERFREARAELLHASLTDLHAAGEDAVSTLRTIAADEKARGSDRVLAARHTLDLLLRGVETIEFAERLARLEEVSRSDQKGRTGT